MAINKPRFQGGKRWREDVKYVESKQSLASR